MLWQRKNSVFNGEFACCRLNHTRKLPSGNSIRVPCDKKRIRPLAKGLWDRKIAHLRSSHPLIKFIFHWRWQAHVHLMMAEEVDDSGEADDPQLRTLDDVLRKYCLVEGSYRPVMKGFLTMLQGLFDASPSFQVAADPWPPQTFMAGAEWREHYLRWAAKWHATIDDANPTANQLAMAVMFVVAEGNAGMVRG